VTQTSRLAWESNNLSLIICTVIGVIVFGAMAYAIFKFRKSRARSPPPSATTPRPRSSGR
jgi:heme/copper-type cytochrome/quinol oxidase subunit 2